MQKQLSKSLNPASVPEVQEGYSIIMVTPTKLNALKKKEGGADFTYQGKHYRWLGDVAVSEKTIAENPKLKHAGGRFINMATETHGKGKPAKKLEIQFQSNNPAQYE
ncbi:hypothetical protein A9299_10030 [Moraxella osloensis]|uniref:Uncharacterized protein n=1 Tax=Faucicola osloensis TaxID=34062 RepID=A0AA91J9N8_FAUOS|nr:hypothetical protein [Moraxella osloensis]OBX64335.1 hypothetical protein A9299_10030 [Moraxella osloensis]